MDDFWGNPSIFGNIHMLIVFDGHGPFQPCQHQRFEVCQTPERFYALTHVLAKMVDVLVETPSIRLLRHVVRCYLRLCDNKTAKETYE